MLSADAECGCWVEVLRSGEGSGRWGERTCGAGGGRDGRGKGKGARSRMTGRPSSLSGLCHGWLATGCVGLLLAVEVAAACAQLVVGFEVADVAGASSLPARGAAGERRGGLWPVGLDRLGLGERVSLHPCRDRLAIARTGSPPLLTQQAAGGGLASRCRCSATHSPATSPAPSVVPADHIATIDRQPPCAEGGPGLSDTYRYRCRARTRTSTGKHEPEVHTTAGVRNRGHSADIQAKGPEAASGFRASDLHLLQ